MVSADTKNESKMDVLLKNDDYVEFLIEFPTGEVGNEFEVYEVTSYNAETNELSDKELYLKGFIKWDGCSHLWFGNEGYLHLCGKHYWDLHKKVIDAVWDYVTPKIEGFNKEIAS